MSKNLPSVWELEPHTAKKHEILRRYFDAWLPIMSKWNGRVVYIDGFAGPGSYSNGEDGSPVIVLKAARDHSYRITAELMCIFVEAKKARFDHLEAVLSELSPTLPANIKFVTVHGAFDEHLTKILQLLEAQKKHLAPSLVFIDPFGFSNTPFETVKSILQNDRCEVLITFMYEEVNRFLSVDSHAADYDRLFGTTKWRDVPSMAVPSQRKRAIHDIYLTQLKSVARYVRSFEMLNVGNSTDYFLFFATNGLKGLEKMKEAMWKADAAGSFQFSDYTDSLRLMPLFPLQPDYDQLRDMMKAEFGSRQVSIEEVGDWVVAETPFQRTHIKRQVLKPMEERGEVVVANASPKRRKGTFPDGTRLKFS
jgi:three-Cys-motif partner protein